MEHTKLQGVRSGVLIRRNYKKYPRKRIARVYIVLVRLGFTRQPVKDSEHAQRGESHTERRSTPALSDIPRPTLLIENAAN